MVHRNGQWPSICMSLGLSGHEDAVVQIHRKFLHEYEVEWLNKRKTTNKRQLNHDRGNNESHGKDTQPVGSGLMVEPTTNQKPIGTPELFRPLTRSHENEYRPHKRKFENFHNEFLVSSQTSKDMASLRPYPNFAELGNVDIQALSRSIQSHLPSEVGHALDVLVIIAGDKRWGLPLSHCSDLLQSLVDCLASNCAKQTKHDQSVYAAYSSVVDQSRHRSGGLNLRSSRCRSGVLEHCAAVEVIMSILTVLRNLAFTEINQEPISRAENLAQVLANAIVTFCGVRSDISLGPSTVLNFMKDMITLLSLIGGSLIIDRPEIANIFTKFILSFAPNELQFDLNSKYYEVSEYPYLAPAIDTFAKLLSRDFPNRDTFKRSFSSDLTQGRDRQPDLMALAVAVFPTTLEADFGQVLSHRIPLLHHSLIVAETAISICPISDHGKTWMDARQLIADRLSDLLRILSYLLQDPGSGVQCSEADLTILSQRATTVLKMLNEQSRSSRTTRRMTRAERAVLLYESGIEV